MGIKQNIHKTIKGILDFVRESKDLDTLMVSLSEDDAAELLKVAMNDKLNNSKHVVSKVVRDLGKFNFYLTLK